MTTALKILKGIAIFSLVMFLIIFGLFAVTLAWLNFAEILFVLGAIVFGMLALISSYGYQSLSKHKRNHHE